MSVEPQPLMDESPADGGAELLFVDLDGTLIGTDLFCEALGGAIRATPSIVRRLPAIILGGRAALKRVVAACTPIDPAALPYRPEVLEFVRQEKARGARVVLATASDEAWAQAVAQHLGLFDDVLASDGRVNLKSSRKLAAIRAYAAQHGQSSFRYIGDSRADVCIWDASQAILVAAPRPTWLAQLESRGQPVQTFGSSRESTSATLRALRPQQWIKNILLFVPLLLAHKLDDVDRWAALAVAWIAWCLCASSAYLLNDLLDLPHDRRHEFKRNRPLAAGEIFPPRAAWLSGSLLLGGLALSAVLLPPAFTGALVVYVLLTILYSVELKRHAMLDVMVLSGLYTLRILAGGLAADVHVSEWLLSLSLFLFTSLAFAKRYSELLRSQERGLDRAGGRGYSVDDLELLGTLGATSGYIAVLVLALYLNSEVVAGLYPHRQWLWLVCPILLYWVSRIWLQTRRGSLREDPVVFALTDRVSLWLGVSIVLIAAIAAVPW